MKSGITENNVGRRLRKATQRLEPLRNRVQVLLTVAEESQAELRQVECEVVHLRLQELERDVALVSLGILFCPTSPIGRCAYDDKDRGHDDCLFCRDPEDRK